MRAVGARGATRSDAPRRAARERLREVIKAAPFLPLGRDDARDQMLLGLEDVEQTAASDWAIADQSAPTERAAGPRSDAPIEARCRRHESRWSSISTTGRPCCQAGGNEPRGQERGAGHRAGAVSVRVTRSPKYACRRCVRPAGLIAGGMPMEPPSPRSGVEIYRPPACTARRRYSLGNVTLWIHRRWPTGSATLPGT